MSNIPIKSAIDDSGAFFPESHERAITDDNGTTLETKLQMVKNPIFTLNFAPTSSTLTHTEGGVTYTFKVGDEVRVHDTEKGTAEGNYYVFFTLKDKSNNTAYWEESGSGGGEVAMNTYSVLIDSNQVDKSDIANARVTYNYVDYASGATITVPHSTAITVSDLSVTSITGYSVDVQVSGWNIIVTYSTEILTVTITATDETSGVSNCSVTVTDGNSTTLGTLTNGQSLKIPYGINYVCTPSTAPSGYNAPSAVTKNWSDTPLKALSFTYEYELVDLGLSVKWAKGNICKDSNGNYYIGEPTDRGCYFSWGNIIGYHVDDGYAFGTDYPSTPGASLTASIASNDSAHDAALACLGNEYRMPTKAEFDELKNNCTMTWVTSYNGVSVAGGIFKSNIAGYTDKEIFIPAAGYFDNTTLMQDNSYGSYFSSTHYTGSSVYCLYSDNSGAGTYFYGRSGGRSVRAVQ